MFKNYFKTTLRNIFKNKSYTLINVIGLSLGIVGALVIFAMIKFESSFDTYHKDLDRLYRVVHVGTQFGKTEYDPGVPYPMPRAMRNDFPEIELLTIVDSNFNSPMISVEHEDGSISRYKEDDNYVTFVEPDYFKLFSYEWLHGNSEQALANPNSVVISKGLAQKYFGQENPLGKRLLYDNDLELQVTGVVNDTPQNTDLPFNMLIAFDFEERGSDNWGSTSTSVQCYLKLSEHIDPQQIEWRFDDFITKHRNAEVAEVLDYRLQPLPEMHFDTRYETFSHRTVAEETLLALALIGIALLITACINFINLNTALAVKRSKEVGVRKVLGSTRSKLIVQFLGETSAITLLAIIVSAATAEIAADFLQSLIGYRLELNLLNDSAILIFLFVLFAIVTLSAGFYPALHISRFSPAEAIRNKLTASYGEGLSLRKGLVVLQFAISQALIFCVLVIGSQIKFLRSAEMGFNKEAVVEVGLPLKDDIKLQQLKTQLLQTPAIKSVAFSNTGTASGNTWGGNYSIKVGEEIREGSAQIKFVDDDFISTYELGLVAGEGLAPTDTLKRFLVNQTFVKDAGYGENYSDFLGTYVKIWGREAPIAGVVKDFNTSSLHHKVQPIVIIMQNRYAMAGIKIDLQNTRQTLKSVEETWSGVYPNFVFDYGFLDDNIEKFYEDEQNISSLINTFAVIAILIGCLGLFGLVSYMAAQRTKEIGIRKVLGATVTNILALFSKEFFVLITIAFVLAAPAAYYIMGNWLDEFAYRIDLNAGIFMLALIISFVIAFVTIGYKSVLAAMTNPVESLRSE